MGPEAKLYQKIKKASPNILWNRIENLSIPGMPDALGVEAHGQRSSKTSSLFLYRGSRIMELDACGLKLEASTVGLEACCLELEACGLTLETLIV
jgi:hypothetical protein